jgi:hypothetical protein
MDCIGRTSSLEADGGINSCNYTLFDAKPVTHVYLPHVIRANDPGCRRFEAHRAESEIARIRSSRIEKSRNYASSVESRVSSWSSLSQRMDCEVPPLPLTVDDPDEDF